MTPVSVLLCAILSPKPICQTVHFPPSPNAIFLGDKSSIPKTLQLDKRHLWCALARGTYNNADAECLTGWWVVNDDTKYGHIIGGEFVLFMKDEKVGK